MTAWTLAFTNDFLSKYQLLVPSAVADLSSTMESAQLEDNYQPSKYDVLCGRGKGSYNRSGNKRFRELVQAHVGDYLNAKTKYDKSSVLNMIVDRVRSKGMARFVAMKDGAWFEISDEQAREKVGHSMREAMSMLEGAEEREEVQKRFDNKHEELLEQQRLIFEKLVRSSTRKNQSQFQQARRAAVAQE